MQSHKSPNFKPSYFTKSQSITPIHHSHQQFSSIIDLKKQYQSLIKAELASLQRMDNAESQEIQEIAKSMLGCEKYWLGKKEIAQDVVQVDQFRIPSQESEEVGLNHMQNHDYLQKYSALRSFKMKLLFARITHQLQTHQNRCQSNRASLYFQNQQKLKKSFQQWKSQSISSNQIDSQKQNQIISIQTYRKKLVLQFWMSNQRSNQIGKQLKKQMMKRWKEKVFVKLGEEVSFKNSKNQLKEKFLLKKTAEFRKDLLEEIIFQKRGRELEFKSKLLINISIHRRVHQFIANTQWLKYKRTKLIILQQINNQIHFDDFLADQQSHHSQPRQLNSELFGMALDTFVEQYQQKTESFDEKYHILFLLDLKSFCLQKYYQNKRMKSVFKKLNSNRKKSQLNSFLKVLRVYAVFEALTSHTKQRLKQKKLQQLKIRRFSIIFIQKLEKIQNNAKFSKVFMNKIQNKSEYQHEKVNQNKKSGNKKVKSAYLQQNAKIFIQQLRQYKRMQQINKFHSEVAHIFYESRLKRIACKNWMMKRKELHNEKVQVIIKRKEISAEKQKNAREQQVVEDLQFNENVQFSNKAQYLLNKVIHQYHLKQPKIDLPAKANLNQKEAQYLVNQKGAQYLVNQEVKQHSQSDEKLLDLGERRKPEKIQDIQNSQKEVEQQEESLLCDEKDDEFSDQITKIKSNRIRNIFNQRQKSSLQIHLLNQKKILFANNRQKYYLLKIIKNTSYYKTYQTNELIFAQNLKLIQKKNRFIAFRKLMTLKKQGKASLDNKLFFVQTMQIKSTFLKFIAKISMKIIHAKRISQIHSKVAHNYCNKIMKAWQFFRSFIERKQKLKTLRVFLKNKINREVFLLMKQRFNLIQKILCFKNNIHSKVQIKFYQKLSMRDQEQSNQNCIQEAEAEAEVYKNDNNQSLSLEEQSDQSQIILNRYLENKKNGQMKIKKHTQIFEDSYTPEKLRQKDNKSKEIISQIQSSNISGIFESEQKQKQDIEFCKEINSIGKQQVNSRAKRQVNSQSNKELEESDGEYHHTLKMLMIQDLRKKTFFNSLLTNIIDNGEESVKIYGNSEYPEQRSSVKQTVAPLHKKHELSIEDRMQKVHQIFICHVFSRLRQVLQDKTQREEWKKLDIYCSNKNRATIMRKAFASLKKEAETHRKYDLKQRCFSGILMYYRQKKMLRKYLEMCSPQSSIHYFPNTLQSKQSFDAIAQYN